MNNFNSLKEIAFKTTTEIKTAFPVFSLITYQEINILSFGVFMILGKQKTPGDIPPGVFCFPQGKQKTPSAIHIIL